MSGNLPMTVKKKAATEVLKISAKYSDAQISQMIKPKKTESDGIGKGPYRGPRCSNWGYSDWAKGLKQKMHSRKGGFNQNAMEARTHPSKLPAST